MTTPTRLIFVEDDQTLGKVLSKELAAAGFEVRLFRTAEGVVECARETQPHVALVDLKLPGRSGLDLLRELRELYPDLQVVMLTGHGGVPEAVEAMRAGAYDFLTKPTRLDSLEQILRRAAEKSDLLLQNELLRRAAAASDDPYTILGNSRASDEIRRLIARIGPAEATVLIQGENGTGKELIARNLHRQSARRDGPCVVLNCAAIPAELVESELFGHERGAFTGADRERPGLFEAAHEGTLILDEVGELPLAIQPSLLRAIQFGEIRPVGSVQTKRVDVRVIAVTNRDLPAEVREGRFREDLYYRLSTLQITAPPLRARSEDVGELASSFLAKACNRSGRRLAFDDGALAALAAHSWPGNVRELENAVTRLSVLVSGDVITAEDVEQHALRPAGAGRPGLPTLNLEELEAIAIAAALEKHKGDKPDAARELGIALRTLYNKLKADE
jgi:DNA-binding NtrC family response regulator